MPQTLLSKAEVRSLAKVSKYTCDLQDIYQVEQREARLKLGIDFYNELIADLVDYSSASEWEDGTTYSAEDVVIWDGIFYQAISETDTEPTTVEFWELAPKFDKDCFNTLWCNYLGVYLALNVVKNSLMHQFVKIDRPGS